MVKTEIEATKGSLLCVCTVYVCVSTCMCDTRDGAMVGDKDFGLRQPSKSVNVLSMPIRTRREALLVLDIAYSAAGEKILGVENRSKKLGHILRVT